MSHSTRSSSAEIKSAEPVTVLTYINFHENELGWLES